MRKDYGQTEPGEVYSLRPEDVWLEEDYPDWVYDHNGQNVSKTREEGVYNRRLKEIMFDIPDVKEEIKGHCQTASPSKETRS